jgi:hypothetical protein
MKREAWHILQLRIRERRTPFSRVCEIVPVVFDVTGNSAEGIRTALITGYLRSMGAVRKLDDIRTFLPRPRKYAVFVCKAPRGVS